MNDEPNGSSVALSIGGITVVLSANQCKAIVCTALDVEDSVHSGGLTADATTQTLRTDLDRAFATIRALRDELDMVTKAMDKAHRELSEATSELELLRVKVCFSGDNAQGKPT